VITDVTVSNEMLVKCYVCVAHSRVLCSDPHPAQDIPLLTDGPHWNLLQAALSHTRQDGDVRQGDRRDLLPGAPEADLTLPVRHNILPLNNSDTLENKSCSGKSEWHKES